MNAYKYARFFIANATDIFVLGLVVGILFFDFTNTISAGHLITVYLMSLLIAPLWVLYLSEYRVSLLWSIINTFFIVAFFYAALNLIPPFNLLPVSGVYGVIFLTSASSLFLLNQKGEYTFEKLKTLFFVRLFLFGVVVYTINFLGLSSHMLADYYGLLMMIPLFMSTEYIALKYKSMTSRLR